MRGTLNVGAETASGISLCFVLKSLHAIIFMLLDTILHFCIVPGAVTIRPHVESNGW